MEDMNPQAQNVGEVNPVAPSPEAEPNAENQSGQVEAASTGDEGLTEAEDRKPSRAERRIREQNSKIKELEAQIGYFQQPQVPPFAQPQYQSGDEITVDQLLNTTNLQAESAADKLRKEFNFRNDMRDVTAKYPELNPDSDAYDPEFDATVADLYQQMGGVMGNTRLTDVVSKVAKLAARNEQRVQAQTQQTLARQAAEGALTPGAEPKRAEGPSLDQLKQQATYSGSDADWAAYFAARRSAK